METSGKKILAPGSDYSSADYTGTRDELLEQFSVSTEDNLDNIKALFLILLLVL